MASIKKRKRVTSPIEVENVDDEEAKLTKPIEDPPTEVEAGSSFKVIGQESFVQLKKIE